MQQHDLRHRLYAKSVLRTGQQMPALPLADLFGHEWLLAHQTHHKMLQRFFVTGTTNEFNLTVDPRKSKQQFYTWHRMHSLVHARIDQVFNSVVRS